MDDDAIPEPVRAAWQGVLGGWDEPARHDAFFQVVVHHGCYAWAAGRYKQKAGDAIADARLAKLQRAAEAALFATAAVRPAASDQGKSNMKLFVVAMLFALVIALATLAVLAARNGAR